MTYQEHAVHFDCEGECLVGVISLPKQADARQRPEARNGLVIIVGGPQYRAGSHRQFVLLARAVAIAGTPVLRFDYRGMGDSAGALRTFEHVTEDIACAINALQAAAPGVQTVALWGLCDGASAALLYYHATQDVRVQGLCLLNPWVRSQASFAKTQVKHYYFQRVLQKEFWTKLLRGGVALQAVSGLARNIWEALSSGSPRGSAEEMQFQDRMAMAWKGFGGHILLLLSGDDYTAKEFLGVIGTNAAWAGALHQRQLVVHNEPEADHTFSQRRFNSVVENCTLKLLRNLTSHGEQETK